MKYVLAILLPPLGSLSVLRSGQALVQALVFHVLMLTMIGRPLAAVLGAAGRQ